MSRQLLAAMFCLGLLHQASDSLRADQIYNLGSDWSNASNPNGVWAYQAGASVLPFFPSWPNAPWATPQAAWGSLPGWFQSNGTELFPHDWIAGDVVTHSGGGSSFESSSVVTWTSPVSGTIDISGDTWKARDIGRNTDWGIYLNNTFLTGGNLASGDSHTRATPFLFPDGSGGASALQNILVVAGDVVSYRLTTGPNSVDDFAGVNLEIDLSTSAVPEPSSLVLLGTGSISFGLIGWFRRNRKPVAA